MLLFLLLWEADTSDMLTLADCTKRGTFHFRCSRQRLASNNLNRTNKQRQGFGNYHIFVSSAHLSACYTQSFQPLSSGPKITQNVWEAQNSRFAKSRVRQPTSRHPSIYKTRNQYRNHIYTHHYNRFHTHGVRLNPLATSISHHYCRVHHHRIRNPEPILYKHMEIENLLIRITRAAVNNPPTSICRSGQGSEWSRIR